MVFESRKTELQEVLPFRELYRHEANCQIVHDSMLSRACADPYAILLDGRLSGYGAVFTKYYPGRVMEFYTFPHCRLYALEMFEVLLNASRATEIEAQTNMSLACEVLFAFGTNIVAENVLFADAATTNLSIPGATFRRRETGDKISNGGEPEGDWVLEVNGEVVSNGGFLCHYNPPYGDVYMETAESHRRKGYGSFLVQEIKRVCYESGKKPGARSNTSNFASQKTLERAGLRHSGFMLAGAVRKEFKK
jgi:GNAT superfamily N-acetyltransferase